MRRHAATTSRPLLALALLCLAARWLPASGQVPQVVWPFTGQGMWPDNLGVVAVTADVHLDRILEINQEAGSWRAVHRVHLSWVDPRAKAAVVSATNDWYNASSPYGTCSMPCDGSMSLEAGCCTSLWLPQIDLPNLLEYNYQMTPPRWRIWVEPVVLSNGSSSSRVHWTVRLDGTWFSPFDFRAWPLEHQHLLVELQPSPVLANKMVLVLGSLSQLSNTPHTKGVDIAGWWINKVTPRMYNTKACFQRSNTTFWVFGMDDASLTSDSNSTSSIAVQHVSISPGDLTTLLSNTTVVTEIPVDSCGAINAEGISQYGPYVLVIDVMVVRDKTFYITIFIVPLLIVTLMVFVIYAMERTNLEARMGVIVTLVLALSALQFMYNFPPASYLNVVQQLTMVSYVLFALIAIECIITSSIARTHERRRNYEATLTAAGLRTLASAKSSGNGGAVSSGTLDFSDDTTMYDFSQQSTKAHPSSGLFFGSQPAQSTSRFLEPQVSLAVNASAQQHNVEEHSSMPLSPIPEADDAHPSRRELKDNGQLEMVAKQEHKGYELEIKVPETARTNDQSHSGGKGQAIGEGVEWSWPNIFRSDTRRTELQRKSDDSQKRTLDPEVTVLSDDPTTQFAKVRQTFGRGRRSVEQLVSSFREKGRVMRQKMSVDEAYAQLLARRVDMVVSLILLLSYIVVVITLLAVSNSVGDHKLMLAGTSAPGNM